MHDVDLSQRLHLAESDFLTALEGGTNVLASYHQRWSTLLDVLHTASKTRSVGHETLSLARSVASHIAILASCFLDIKRVEESSTTLLRSDYEATLHQMAALDLNSQPGSLQPDNRNGTRCSRSSSTTPVYLNAGNSSPPFVASVHRWLMDNLHNPYPTAEAKVQIAAASSCQVSSVNSWFINARRRIGWTALCRERFSNCRADMIDAAYRALVEEDPKRPLSPELRHSFIAVKVAAESLHSSTFTRSAFAEDLDGTIKDMTEQSRGSTEIGKPSQVEQPVLPKTIRDSYPSPDRSTVASPIPALDSPLTKESEEEVDIAPPIIAGSKRRRASIEPVDQPSTSVRRPIKRLRASTTPRTHLPSPPSSTDGIDVPSDDGSSGLPPVPSIQLEANNVLPSRKRRLSDADTVRTPKRLCEPMPAPCLHAVSDPLPRSNVENEHSIDDWFNTNFDALFSIPHPVDATEPDFSAPWEVELFRDYCIPGSPTHAPRCPPAPMTYTQVSAPTDLSDLDSLLQSIGGDTFATPLENVTGASYSTPFDSSIPDMSQTPIDWNSLLNYSDVYQPSPNPQSLPEIDLSMLHLPHTTPTVNPQGDFASREAKLCQLHAMQETVRRMEQELQAEGVVI